jgi:hypothetical protein
MDLFAITESFWRHKLATIPVIMLTAIAMFYIVAVRPPTYASSADVLLENPPSAPSIGQIDVNPKLAKINANNPLASLENLVQVADVLSQMETSAAGITKLEQEGVSPGFEVVPDSSLETPPVIDITGVGTSPQTAIRSAQMVATDIQKQLYQLQVEQNVNKEYLITSIEYIRPSIATSSSSSKLRSAVVVLVIGLILLLVTVTASQSIAERRRSARPRPTVMSDEDTTSSQNMQSATPNGRHRPQNESVRYDEYDQPQRPPIQANEGRPTNPTYQPGGRNFQDDRRWLYVHQLS